MINKVNHVATSEQPSKLHAASEVRELRHKCFRTVKTASTDIPLSPENCRFDFVSPTSERPRSNGSFDGYLRVIVRVKRTIQSTFSFGNKNHREKLIPFIIARTLDEP